MGPLFPIRSPVEVGDGEPRLLEIDGEAADEVFEALSAGTARELLAAVYDEPRPASELADAVDTSLQNTRYHLEKLQDAGLVEVADTWYSERGSEMKVYAPTDSSVVVVAGDEDTTASVFDVVRSLLGAVAVLAVVSVAVNTLVETLGAGPTRVGTPGEPTTTTVDRTVTMTQTTTTTTTTTTTPAPGIIESVGALPPGVLFFLGGLTVLAGLTVVWYWRA
ncbi:MAG: ArsR/SmtB family transcription factor [Halobacteriaceae archaeon]